MDLKRIEEEVIDLCSDVATFISSELGQVADQQIEHKELNSLVSYVDKTAEVRLVEKLIQILPEASFITEESTVRQEKTHLNWIIDPLDGTNNFLHEIPHFAISIALRENDQIVLGVIFDIMRNECFHATHTGGAFRNYTPIKVSRTKSITNALIGTGFPYTNSYDPGSQMKTLVYWLKNARGVRRFGAAALDLAYVACGRFDSFYETRLKIWDVAAGIILVKEAGGTVSDFQGLGKFTDGSEIVASNSKLHPQIVEVLKNNFSRQIHLE